MGADLVFVDLETTGLDERTHEIVEVAAIRVDPVTFAERARFVGKVQPLLGCDPKAAAKNGYNPRDWRSAMWVDEALRGLFPIIEGARWAGSNPHFDFRFVRVNAAACGREMPALATHRLVDVSAMAEPLVHAGLIQRAGLESLREYFKIDTGPAHRAESDALAALAAYRCMIDVYEPAIAARRAE